MKKKEIVFVNQSSGYLMIDIIDAYEGCFEKTVLVTGALRQRNKMLSRNTKVHKIIEYDNKTKIGRMMTWIVALFQIVWIIKRYYKNAELFLVSNPPVSILVPLFCKNSFTYLVYDVYPDAIIDTGILKKSSLVIRFWSYVNKVVFRKAYKIFTIGEGMKRRLMSYVDESRIKIVPLWADNDFYHCTLGGYNRFIRENKLDDKFIVLYSGNLGYTHDVEVIIDVAEVVDQEDIVFVVIGDGERRRSLEERIIKKKLKNCMMLPWQDSAMLPYVLSSADIAVVSLSSSASNLSIPSKMYSYMSAGAPLLGVASDDSDLSILIRKYNVGQCFEKNKISDIVKYVNKVYYDEEYQRLLKINVAVAAKDFTKKNATLFISDVC